MADSSGLTRASASAIYIALVYIRSDATIPRAAVTRASERPPFSGGSHLLTGGAPPQPFCTTFLSCPHLHRWRTRSHAYMPIPIVVPIEENYPVLTWHRWSASLPTLSSWGPWEPRGYWIGRLYLSLDRLDWTSQAEATEALARIDSMEIELRPEVVEELRRKQMAASPAPDKSDVDRYDDDEEGLELLRGESRKDIVTRICAENQGKGAPKTSETPRYLPFPPVSDHPPVSSLSLCPTGPLSISLLPGPILRTSRAMSKPARASRRAAVASRRRGKADLVQGRG
eukprot:1192518-Prorocentrum_minimum.AAC.6